MRNLNEAVEKALYSVREKMGIDFPYWTQNTKHWLPKGFILMDENGRELWDDRQYNCPKTLQEFVDEIQRVLIANFDGRAVVSLDYRMTPGAERKHMADVCAKLDAAFKSVQPSSNR